MSYYHSCPDCGAALDPGEKCDCYKKSERLERKYIQLTSVDKDGQIIFGGMANENNKNKNPQFIRA